MQNLANLDLTREVSDFVVNAPRGGVSSQVAHHNRRLIIDTIGVMLAAAPHEIGRIVTRFADRERHKGTASILGGGRRTSPEMAALANATLANALDFDEGFHVSTHTIPAALAVAEHHDMSGADLLDAIVVGYEAGVKITRLVDAKRREKKGPTAHGWWHVGLVGPVAAALTVARLLKLDMAQTRTAIGIATCSSGGFRRNMGTMSKALHSGNAARGGIEAVMLARSGFTADTSILEAPLGFVAAMCGADDYDASGLRGALGAPYSLENYPPVKSYPACTPGHSLIEGGKALHRHLVDRLDSIAAIQADLHGFSLLRPDAEDEDAAGFSGAYLLASAIVHGDFNLAHLTHDALHDERVRRLMKLTIHTPAAVKGTERIVVKLRGGEEIVQEGPDRPRRLTTDDEVARKFLACADGAIGAHDAHELLGRLNHIDRQDDLRRIMTLARGRSA